MLSWVGRARCLPCLFLFMQFSSNELPKVAFEPRPGTEPSMRKMCRPVQSRFCGRNGRASSERNSCREAAQSNIWVQATPGCACLLMLSEGSGAREPGRWLEP